MTKGEIMNNSLLRQAALQNRGEIIAPYDTIIDLDGFGAICAFCDMLGGATVYVPAKRRVFQHCLEAEAIREYNGYNFKELKKKYEFSESHLRKILKG
jgi:hypothetical protein